MYNFSFVPLKIIKHKLCQIDPQLHESVKICDLSIPRLLVGNAVLESDVHNVVVFTKSHYSFFFHLLFLCLFIAKIYDKKTDDILNNSETEKRQTLMVKHDICTSLVLLSPIHSLSRLMRNCTIS